MRQDMHLLSREVKSLQLEIEALRREIGQIRASSAASDFKKDIQERVNTLSSAIETLERKYQAADEARNHQIMAWIRENRVGLNKDRTKTVETGTDSGTTVHFPDDYPKTGLTYTVRAGDTLTAIARRYGSAVKHIQHANKIANPSSDLRVGETIFIPIVP